VIDVPNCIPVSTPSLCNVFVFVPPYRGSVCVSARLAVLFKTELFLHSCNVSSGVEAQLPQYCDIWAVTINLFHIDRPLFNFTFLSLGLLFFYSISCESQVQKTPDISLNSLHPYGILRGDSMFCRYYNCRYYLDKFRASMKNAIGRDNTHVCGCLM
jgi:hypothetical protein